MITITKKPHKNSFFLCGLVLFRENLVIFEHNILIMFNDRF